MRSSTLSLFSLGLAALILASCSTSSSLVNNSILEKRRYSKGYHVNIQGFNNQNIKSVKSEEIERADAKPVNAIEASTTAQASLAGELTDADFKPKTVSPFSSSSTTTKAENANTNLATEIVEIKNHERTGKRISKTHQNSSSIATPAPVMPQSGGGSLLLYIILAILLPPLAVGLLYGIGTEFWISLVLSLIFWVPGIIYALIKVFQRH